MLTPIIYGQLQGIMGVGKHHTMWIRALSCFGKLKGGVLCIRGGTSIL